MVLNQSKNQWRGAHSFLTRRPWSVHVTPVQLHTGVPFTQPVTLLAEAYSGQLLKLLLISSRATSVRTFTM